MRGDALGAGDVYERVVAGGVRFLGDRVNGLQLLRGIQKALVSARDVIVYFDPENVGVGGPADDLIRIVEPQAVTGDADVVRPVLVGLAVEARPTRRGIRRRIAAASLDFTEWHASSHDGVRRH